MDMIRYGEPDGKAMRATVCICIDGVLGMGLLGMQG
jgi:hypothetical protein